MATTIPVLVTTWPVGRDNAISIVYTVNVVSQTIVSVTNTIGTVDQIITSSPFPEGVTATVTQGQTVTVNPQAKLVTSTAKSAEPASSKIPGFSSPTASPESTSPTIPETGSPQPSHNQPSNTGNPAKTKTAGASQTSNALPAGSQTNGGAIAGAAVGCLIAGALLGFIIAFFIYRKRSRGHANYMPPPTVVETKAHGSPPPLIDPGLQLSKFLLDSTPDKEIASELRSLSTLIQQHVENNYHLQPVQADSRALAISLTQLGVSNGSGTLSPEAVAQLALDPRTRQVALQHVISQVVFAGVDVNSRSRLSMLPAPIAAFLQSIPPRESGERNHEVLSNALNQWRALSAYILHPSRSQRTPLPVSHAAVAPQASGLADALDTFLGYFVLAGDEKSRYQQKSHLQAVIIECTKLGYILLSQPSEWRFVNIPGSSHGGHGHMAVVCAGLVKVTQKDGTPYNPPQQVVAPMTVSI